MNSGTNLLMVKDTIETILHDLQGLKSSQLPAIPPRRLPGDQTTPAICSAAGGDWRRNQSAGVCVSPGTGNSCGE